jgi:hypothetical protein
VVTDAQKVMRSCSTVRGTRNGEQGGGVRKFIDSSIVLTTLSVAALYSVEWIDK